MLLQSSTMKAFILALLVILPCDILAFVPPMPTATAQIWRGSSTRMTTRMSSHHDSDSKGAARSRIEHAVAVAVASSVVVFGTACGPALAEDLPPGELLPPIHDAENATDLCSVRGAGGLCTVVHKQRTDDLLCSSRHHAEIHDMSPPAPKLSCCRLIYKSSPLRGRLTPPATLAQGRMQQNVNGAEMVCA